MSRLPAAKEAAAGIWRSLVLPESALSRLRLTGEPDSAVNLSFRPGTAAQASIGLAGLSAAHFHQMRTGITQDVNVAARHAVISFYSEAWYMINGKSPEGDIWDPIAGLYKAKGGGYVRIHTNFPQLECLHPWADHVNAKSLSRTMPVSSHKIGEAPKQQVGKDMSYPLEVHGMDVLLVTFPKIPSLPLLDTETSMGKHMTQLDLTMEADCKTLTDLARDADVFLQAYQPGGLEKLGFGPNELAALCLGIVSANLCAWGWDGPWKDHQGFDSLVQMATGFNVAEGSAYQEFIGKGMDELINPQPLPMKALDHAAGYFLALGINAALCRTIIEGGSWEVHVSLAVIGLVF
ncbi:hypothetical protein DXG01_001436 [Tephrocybe rancida]|nr:hypothetical protein DXG01_001436 [Tephrocybe rancida]